MNITNKENEEQTTEKIMSIREAMPATLDQVYLNTGSVGPLPTVASEAMRKAITQELTDGRASFKNFMEFRDLSQRTRRAMARLVKAEPEEIALTHHTTDGMNIVTHGLNWQAGDEVVTTTSEHEGGLLPLYVLRQRFGVNLNLVDIAPGDDIIARLEAAITPRTRLLVFSHVTWNTGLRLPMSEIVDMAHRHHVLCLVDGAQSFGAIPLDLPESGVDFYAMPGQKWLCGPTGTGALYVRKDRLSLVAPTFVGYQTLAEPGSYDHAGYFVPSRDASRYEVGTVHGPGIHGLLASLEWLENQVKWNWIFSRITQMARYVHEALSRLSGVTLITPPNPKSGLVTFNLDGYDPARVVIKLSEQNIIIRFLKYPYALRVATGFYNTKSDIDRLIEALQEILDSDPESLPQFDL